MPPSSPPTAVPAFISPQELNRLLHLDPRPRILDVRTPEEFAAGHVPTAANVPLDGLDPASLYRSGVLRPAEPVFLVCRTSNRARSAAAAFAAAGHGGTVVVEGGTLAWVAGQFPVETGPADLGRVGR
jgi:rhodanese-related sulfurtransferase